MKVFALDHVNIVTDDLDGTARFYEELLGLKRRDAPAPMTPQEAQWMYDAEARAIVHINSTDLASPVERDVTKGPTGAIHHVAFSCSGFDEMLARLDALGMDRQLNTIESIGLRQIFALDPNEILLELNFFGD